MLTKYALAAVIVLCLTVLGFTLLVGDSLCEFTVKERNIEFKVVLAYEPKKEPLCGEQSPHIRLSGQDGKAPALHFRPRSVMAAGDFVLRAMMSFADRSPKQDSLYK